MTFFLYYLIHLILSRGEIFVANFMAPWEWCKSRYFIIGVKVEPWGFVGKGWEALYFPRVV